MHRRRQDTTGRRPSADARKVFVVHGRNLEVRDAMHEFLRSIGLQPLEWEEAVRHAGVGAPHIGEILRHAFARVQAVIVLLTGDDEARLRSHLSGQEGADLSYRPQARPNVLFEAGMAFATHPARTILVQIGELRPFSDIAGRHVIRFDGSPEHRRCLATRLETVGCAIDLQNDAWLSAGDFGAALQAPPRRPGS
jgi:predicted nucleotide-binding protein